MPRSNGVLTKTRSIPLGIYPSGSRDIGPLSFPNGLDGFQIRIGRKTTADPTIWSDPNTTITIAMLFSFDGGLTYPHSEFFLQNGGLKVGRDGEIPEDIVAWNYDPDHQPTNGKATITVANGPVKTYLDVTIDT
jgi:hypothetical protein